MKIEKGDFPPKKIQINTTWLSISFFFFFLRINTCKLYYSMDEISDITKDIMSGGTDSIQTTIGKESLAPWAKAWTTELPCLPTWEKEQL